MTEAVIHAAVVEHLRKRGAPGLLWWHTPNDGKRSFKSAARLKKMGMLRGVSDICALYLGEFYALELKADKGRATDSQIEFLSDVANAGGHSCVAFGLNQALRWLEEKKLLK